MTHANATKLDRPVDGTRDHILGNSHADMTLVEYGSYACPYCHAAHEIIAGLRDRFGDRMRIRVSTSAHSRQRRSRSEPALQAMDVIHDRIESPASKLLRSVEPWSSYVVLPIFALANAGVVWSHGVFEGHGPLMAGIMCGLVIGKPIGIFSAAWLAARFGIALKPTVYSWRQLFGTGALAGIGFTMSYLSRVRRFPAPTTTRPPKLPSLLLHYWRESRAS